MVIDWYGVICAVGIYLFLWVLWCFVDQTPKNQGGDEYYPYREEPVQLDIKPVAVAVQRDDGPRGIVWSDRASGREETPEVRRKYDESVFTHSSTGEW